MGKIGPVRRRDENELEQSPAKRRALNIPVVSDGPQARGVLRERGVQLAIP